MSIAPPQNKEAEWSVVSGMLRDEKIIAAVVGSQVGLDDFFDPSARLVFEQSVQSFYAGERADSVTVGDRLRRPLAAHWRIEEEKVAERLWTEVQRRDVRSSLDHVNVVKRNAGLRRIAALTEQAQREIEEGQDSPEEIGDRLATEVSRVVTGTEKRSEVLTFDKVGDDYMAYLARVRRAKKQGIEVGVYTGMRFVDHFSRGIAPTEVMFVAGPPGVGKSALTWEMSLGFARRQMVKPPERRIGTLIFSLEMGLIGSTSRVATALTGEPGENLREGDVSDESMSKLASSFKNMAQLPLYFNFASNFKMTQMRALIVEAIRRHNVGLVVVDHFRMFDPDRRINNANQEDEAKARFLAEDIAKDLNVAVICLAHTTKLRRESGFESARPVLADLRGSGQVAAFAHMVAFMYRPWQFATEEEKEDGAVKITDAEMIFEKNRTGDLGRSDFYFEPSIMTIRDKYPNE